MSRDKYNLLFYLAVLIAIAMFLFGYWLPMMEAKEGELEALKQEKKSLLEQNIELKQIRDELQDMQYIYQEVKEIKMILSGAREMEVTLTAYAPLDPRAVKGMDYSGDPNITASGELVVPGETAAGGPGMMGKLVWVEGYGMRRINDRGAAIGNGDIDLAVWCRDEALQIGRSKARVFIIES